jgi:hypothetical protein
MGVDPKTVGHWSARGFLATSRTRRPRRAGTGRGGPTILIHDLDLHAMLLNRAAWPAVDPARIVDADWRQAAEEARAAAGGQWEAVADVVRGAGYTPQQVARFLAAYPSSLRLASWKRAHYLWSEDVPAFVAWLSHPRPRPTRGRP